MLKRISMLGWLIMAVLLIDAGADLRRKEYWGAARTLLIVALLPLAFRSPKSDELRPPTS
jgi:hypothetical protein